MFSHLPPLDFLNLQRFPETVEDLPADTYNPQFIADLNKQLNDQSDRLEDMFMEIVTSPDHKVIEYKDVMHWKARFTYLKNVGQGRAAQALEKAQALKEAKEADNDDEFMEGYKEFLATEFDGETIEVIDND